MKWLSKVSSGTFKALKITEALLGLPKAIGDTLHFRSIWDQYAKQSPGSSGSLWIHGASVGELEDLANFFLDQELLELSGYKKEDLIITSSSVSADAFLRKLSNKLSPAYAGPLPPENAYELNRFYSKFNPELMILSHGDIWPLSLEIAQETQLKHGIIWLPSHASSAKVLLEKSINPTKLKVVGARNSEDQLKLSRRLDPIFPQSEIVLVGNPRIDRIDSRVEYQKKNDVHILESHRCAPEKSKVSLLLGSAWVEDAAILADTLKNISSEELGRLQIVVIPHVVNDMHVTASIQHLLPMARVLSVEGILLEAYQNFSIAFVGGGFKSGLHSVLEPALWGVPVICGPQLRKQPDAITLQRTGALKSVLSSANLQSHIQTAIEGNSTWRIWQTAALDAQKDFASLKGASRRLSTLISQVRVDHK
ncbi:hypothetical protein GW916_01130 [bacterium]|nr:hypothetical protein [bacterium]